MGLNYNLWSPSIRDGLAFDVRLDPSLRGIDVLADGVLVVKDVTGKSATYTFTDVSSFSRLGLQIETIVGDGAGGVGNGVTGTSIPLASLVGLR